MNHALVVYKKREEKLKKDIVDLRDKVGDFGFRIDYLDCKVTTPQHRNTVRHLTLKILFIDGRSDAKDISQMICR